MTKNIHDANTARLIKEGHAILDRIESTLKGIVTAIKAKQEKKAA